MLQLEGSIGEAAVTKRVVTKVGEVFETTDGKHLLQLAAIDSMQLSSDVVIVYRASATTELTRLQTKPVLFYHHTTISAGIKQGLWHKIGNAPLPDISKLLFKSYVTPDEASILQGHPRFDHRRSATQPHWLVWTPLDIIHRSLSVQRGFKLEAENGWIIPASQLMERINNDGATTIPLSYPGQSLQPRLNDVHWLNKGFDTVDHDAIEHVDGEWYACGEFSLYDAYDRVYNKTKPFYRKNKGNKDGDLGYRFEFIACSAGFPQIADRCFTPPVPKNFLIVKEPKVDVITETLRLRVGHAHFKTINELRDYLEKFCDVSELDYSI